MSELIGRELVEAIDKLIRIRIEQAKPRRERDCPDSILRDDAELVKRDLTDALLAMDSRNGVYVSGTPIHSSQDIRLK